MKTKILFVCLLTLVFTACGSKKSDVPSGMTEEEYASYKNTLSSISAIEHEFDGITKLTAEEAVKIVSLAEQLYYMGVRKKSTLVWWWFD